MTKRRKKLRAKKQTKILAGIVLVLIVGIAVLTGYQLITDHRSSGSKIRVVLDNAHGGDGSGYQGLFSEDEYNEKVVSELEALLSARSNYTVTRIHAPSQPMNAATRVEAINSASADLVLSIACHNGDSPNMTHMMVFAQPSSMKTHKDSVSFAEAITAAFKEKGYEADSGYYYFKPEREGLFQEHLVPLSDETDYGEETFALMSARAPVVIASLPNVDSQEDMDKWNTEEGIKEAANLYFLAITSIYGK